MTKSAASRLENLAAAFALAVTDDLQAAIEKTSAMTGGASAALTTMLAYPGESLDALRRVLRLTPSGAGRLIDRLVEAGMVERQSGATDQRFISLHLTPRGIKLAERILAARRAAMRRPLASLTAEERALFESLLDKMLYAMTPDRERCDHICRLCEITACPQDICPVETAAQARAR